MRKNFLLMVVFISVVILSQITAVAATDAALEKMGGDSLARFHFVGTSFIAADPIPVQLKKIGVMPVTSELRNSVLNKLAGAPFRLFKDKMFGPGTNDYVLLLRPMLDDLLAAESYAEMRGPTNAVPEFMLAVQLKNDRADFWRSNLATILTAWTGIPVTEIKGQGFTGWELKKHKAPDVIRCLQVGDWLLFGWGSGDLQLQPEFIQRIKKTKRPVEITKDDYLDVMIDWPTIMAHHTIKLLPLLPTTLPKMHLTVAPRQTYLRPKLVMQFPQPLGLKLDPWKIPTNLIHNPIVSFTAIRGIETWLGQVPEIKELHPATLPNQATIWSMNNLPFGSRIAVPVQNGNAYMAQVGPQLVASINEGLQKRGMSSTAELTNNRIVMNGGTPFVNPYVYPMHDTTGDFLLGGLFAILPRTNEPPVPQDLLRTVMADPKTVYYNWEINEGRIFQWEAISQVYLLSAERVPASTNSAGIKWIQAASTNLGNCQTEVSLTAPNELTLIRSAPIGLTALEITLLQYWIDSPGFPLEVEYPKRSLRAPKLPIHK